MREPGKGAIQGSIGERANAPGRGLKRLGPESPICIRAGGEPVHGLASIASPAPKWGATLGDRIKACFKAERTVDGERCLQLEATSRALINSTSSTFDGKSDPHRPTGSALDLQK